MIYRGRFKELFNSSKNKMKKSISEYGQVVLSKINKVWKSISWKSPKSIGVQLIALLIFLGGIVYLSTTTSVVGIMVNGNHVGYVSGMTEAKGLVEDVLEQEGAVVGTTAKTSDTIQYKKIRVRKGSIINTLTVSDLRGSITPYIEGFGLRIQDKTVAVLLTKEEIETLLNTYTENITKPTDRNIIQSAEFEEDYSIIAVQTHPEEVKTIEEALDMLNSGNISETEYTVQQDDSWWMIARNNNMMIDDVLKGNPEFTEDSIIHPGQTLKIVRSEPYFNVVSSGIKTVNEVIPFDVVTQLDSKLGYSQRVIRQAGKDGEKTVTYNYVEKNGKTIEKEVLKEEIITQPVKQIIAKGPNPPANVTVGTSRGSGTIAGLSWPLSGQITSYYGYRWGGFHTGIDINGVTGQPIAAAAGGKVASAGWAGNYGYAVLVDHGNGVATRYAHASKLNVKLGDTVSKGQTIALVGSTGRSSGSHLHFEVIINGSTVNPLNYL